MTEMTRVEIAVYPMVTAVDQQSGALTMALWNSVDNHDREPDSYDVEVREVWCEGAGDKEGIVDILASTEGLTSYEAAMAAAEAFRIAWPDAEIDEETTA